MTSMSCHKGSRSFAFISNISAKVPYKLFHVLFTVCICFKLYSKLSIHYYELVNEMLEVFIYLPEQDAKSTRS